MAEKTGEINLSMVQPLDTDTTVNALRQSEDLIQLTEWSRAKKDYKNNSDYFLNSIVGCMLIGILCGYLAWRISSKTISTMILGICMLGGCVLGCILFFIPESRRKKMRNPKPESPARVLESLYGVHIMGSEDQPLFDETGFKHILIQKDGTHFAPATLFVWVEKYNFAVERTWPMVYIALFDENGIPVERVDSESREVVRSVGR